jgi:hypothetical protein
VFWFAGGILVLQSEARVFRVFRDAAVFLPGVKNAWRKVAMGMFADFKRHEVAMCFRVKRLEWSSPAENRDQQHPENHA